jgi:hypothetical protein
MVTEQVTTYLWQVPVSRMHTASPTCLDVVLLKHRGYLTVYLLVSLNRRTLTGYGQGNVKERDHLVDLGKVGIIILETVSGK